MQSSKSRVFVVHGNEAAETEKHVCLVSLSHLLMDFASSNTFRFISSKTSSSDP